jgi:outer membrane protein assembly factor BamB
MSALPVHRLIDRLQIHWQMADKLARYIFVGVAFICIGCDSVDDDQAFSTQIATTSTRQTQTSGNNGPRELVNLIDARIPTTWNAEPGKHLNIKWVAKLGSRSLGGPVIAGGRVYVGTNNAFPPKTVSEEERGVLMCFREADGEFLGKAVHRPTTNPFSADHKRLGMTSTPAVVGNSLYYLSNSFDLMCVDTERFLDSRKEIARQRQDGEPPHSSINWRLDLKKELGIVPHAPFINSPLVVGDNIFLVTGNAVDEGHLNVPAPEAPSFIAVNRKTGKVIWKDNSPSAKIKEGLASAKDPEACMRQLQNRGLKILHGQWSSPAYGVVNGKPQVIFPGGDGWVYSFEPDTGKLIWRFDCNPKDSLYLLGGRGARSELIATPIIYENRVYLGVGQDPEHGEGVGHLWCIDMTKTGDVSPEIVVDESKYPPMTTPNKNSAKVWHYGGPSKGHERLYMFGRTMSTCVIQDGLLYAAELGGCLHCLDARTGQKLWEQDFKAALWGSPYWVDSKVYIGTEDNDVWVLAHGKEKKVLATIKMNESIHSTPVVANGVLYIMTDSELYAIAQQ